MMGTFQSSSAGSGYASPFASSPAAGSRNAVASEAGGKEPFSSAIKPSSSQAPASGKLPSSPRVTEGQSQQLSPGTQQTSKVEPELAPEKAAPKSVPKMETVDSLQDRLALQSFMRKMKDELGVEPSEVMAAFQALNVAELMRPPEQNIEKLVENLGLGQEDSARATELFTDLMDRTTAKSMADYINTSGRQLSIEVMSKQEAHRRELQSSLENLNHNFFMAGMARMPQQEATQSQPTGQAQQQSSMPGMMAQGQHQAEWLGAGTQSESATSLLGSDTEAGAARSMFDGSQQGSLSLEGMEPVVPQTQAANPAPQSWEQMLQSIRATKAGDVGAQASNAATEASPMAVAQSLDAYEAMPDLPVEDLLPKAPSAPSGSAFKLNSTPSDSSTMLPVAMGQEQGDSHDSMESGESFPEEAFTSSAGATATNQISSQKSAGDAFAMMVQTTPTEAQEKSNVRELVQQAQFMIRKGGGEMKVHLNPEGLGEVSMKVSVENGQVQVEMITESNEAKKLIEKGLGELKANLASHKLNVDQIKVDLSQDIANQLDQERQDAERHFARQFMDDFRQGNQGFRNNFFELPGVRAYRSQTGEGEDTTASVEQARARREGRGSGRLNLVA